MTFGFLVAFVVVLVVMWRRHSTRRGRGDGVYDATLAQLQADAHAMPVFRRDPKTGRVDL